MLDGTPARPELSGTQAERFTRSRVLARAGRFGAEVADHWDPFAEPWTLPDVTVEPGPPGAVQMAVEAAIAGAKAAGHPRHVVIGLAPGRHAGLVYLPRVRVGTGWLSFTLRGTGAVLEDNIDAEMTGAEYRRRFAAQFEGVSEETREIFERIAARDKITTANASVLRVEADGTRLGGFGIVNTYNCDRPEAMDKPTAFNAAGQAGSGQHQAVALLSASADRLHAEGLRLSSFQDTLYLQGPKDRTVRAFVRDCEIEGDVDFIFGQATAWFEDCTIRSRGTRAEMAWATAPSTSIRAEYGLVFDACDFTHDGSPRALAGRFQLGRQWFEGVRATPYGTSPVDGFACRLGPASAYEPPSGTISRETLESVGKCVVLNSRLGAHLHPAAPWGDWNGGDRDPSGAYRPAPWHPRFRPVQTGPSAFLRLLGPWLAEQGLDYSGLDPDEAWLGEFACGG
ncbi:pectinesterase family protein [Mangrovicoccus sp. HB161399]|uniref:pectinesterase family protein n=1 Tax=Mangrovicoccus sp. HB161399 TaxID=2720392 RepID=UPI001C1301A3|nr:pectinesterase family protein [Mangrovicoccus sp. HB161399]